jgi:hypothetical protein
MLTLEPAPCDLPGLTSTPEHEGQDCGDVLSQLIDDEDEQFVPGPGALRMH